LAWRWRDWRRSDGGRRRGVRAWTRDRCALALYWRRRAGDCRRVRNPRGRSRLLSLRRLHRLLP
jgi:hypothetical protein